MSGDDDGSFSSGEEVQQQKQMLQNNFAASGSGPSAASNSNNGSQQAVKKKRNLPGTPGNYIYNSFPKSILIMLSSIISYYLVLVAYFMLCHRESSDEMFN